MKRNDPFLRFVAGGLVALGMFMLAASARAENVPQIIRVLRVEGSAQYSTDGKSWQTLHRDDVLQAGTIIRTAEKSLVDVLFSEKSETSAVKLGGASYTA